MSSSAVSWEHHLLFPTRILIQQNHNESMRQSLSAMFDTEPCFHEEHFADVADARNLMDLANAHPALTQLKQFFLDGARAWLSAESIKGNYQVHSYLFPNFSKSTEFVPAHNHIAHLSGVYYVDVPDYGDQPLLHSGDHKDYWHMDYGVLILHDPKFNASLAELKMANYAKLFPKPGLGILFPSYLWHSVTPHLGEKRASIAVNFTFTPENTPLPDEMIRL